MEHPFADLERYGHAFAFHRVAKHFGVASRCLRFAALDEYGREVFKICERGRKPCVFRIGVSAIKGDPADVFFMLFKTLSARKRIHRVCMAVFPVRVAACGEVGKGRDQADRAWQGYPFVAEPYAGREQKICSHAVACGKGVFPVFGKIGAAGRKAFVMHGGKYELSSCHVIDECHPCGKRPRESHGHGSVSSVDGARASAAVQI